MTAKKVSVSQTLKITAKCFLIQLLCSCGWGKHVCRHLDHTAGTWDNRRKPVLPHCKVEICRMLMCISILPVKGMHPCVLCQLRLFSKRFHRREVLRHAAWSWACLPRLTTGKVCLKSPPKGSKASGSKAGLMAFMISRRSLSATS